MTSLWVQLTLPSMKKMVSHIIGAYIYLTNSWMIAGQPRKATSYSIIAGYLSLWPLSHRKSRTIHSLSLRKVNAEEFVMRTCGHIQTSTGSVLVISYSLPITSSSTRWSPIDLELPRMSQTSTRTRSASWNTSHVVWRQRIGILVLIE